MPVTLSLLTLTAFLAAALAVAGVYSVVSDLFLRDRLRVNQRVEEEFSLRKQARTQKSALFKELGKLGADLGKFGLEGPATLDQPVPTLWQRFVEMVEQSGLNLTPRRLLILAGVCAGVLGVVAFLVVGVFAAPPAALAGAAAPLLVVRLKQKKRRDKLLSQLPDALDLMGRAVRAGQTMSQALQAIADEFQAPISLEFAYCYEQMNLGLSPELAFQDMARRTGLLEIKIFILAMMVQRQTGGNLAELLEKLAGVVRDRFRIRGKIKVLTAEGRIQALVLLAMPPVVFLLMLLVNPDYTLVLLDHPYWLAGLGVMMGIGALWIRRIVNFDF